MLLSLIISRLLGLQKASSRVRVTEDVLLTREKELIAQWTPERDAEARREGWTMVQVHGTPLLALHVLNEHYAGLPEHYVRMRGHAGSKTAWIAHDIHWQLSVARKLAMEGRLRKLPEPDPALRSYAEWLGRNRTIYDARHDGIQIIADDEVRRSLAACGLKGAVVSVLIGSTDQHPHSRPKRLFRSQ